MTTTDTFASTKRSMLALSHAMERSLEVVRESPTRTPRALVIGLFQRPEYFEAERERYVALAAEGALCIVVYAGPDLDASDGVHVVSLDRDDPLARMWVVIIVDGTLGTSLVAQDRDETAEGEPTLEASRLFAARWSFAPRTAAAEAAEILDALRGRLDPAVWAEAVERLQAAAHSHPNVTEQRLTAVAELLVRSVEQASRRSSRLNSQLRRSNDLSELDPLTGLNNRRYLDRFLHSPAADSPISLVALLVDLDGLKSINDAAGHLAGDAALVAVSSALRDATRPQDVVVRMGGDEFLVALPGYGLEAGELVAERIAAKIAASTLAPPWDDIPISVSIGVAMATPNQIPMEQLDEALYWVKQHGKGGVQLAERIPTAS